MRNPTEAGNTVLGVVPWAIPGRCPLCGEFAELDFDDLNVDGEPPGIMLKDVACVNAGCQFFHPDMPVPVAQ
jgi:hypothetical protein